MTHGSGAGDRRGRRAVALGALLALGALPALVSSCGGQATPAPPTDAVGGASQPASQPVPVSTGPTGTPTPSTGSSPGPGDIAIPDDPCSILTATEVLAATGIAFPVGSSQSAGSTVECDYATDTAAVQLVIQPLDKGAFATGRSAFTPLVGLGDDAYQRAAPSQLHVAMANIEITAQAALGGTAAADQAAELALMKLVIAKLAT